MSKASLCPLVSVFHLFLPKGKNRRGKSKTIVGEIPTIDFMLFLIFCPIKWAFEIRKCVNNTVDEITAVGYQALVVNTTGQNNTGIGVYALTLNTTGYQNTAVGYDSLGSNTSGYQNTTVGYNAGNTLTTQTNCLLLGDSAQINPNFGNNQCILGNGIEYLYCNVGLTAPSDRRMKKDIVPISDTLGLHFVNKLLPVEFT